MSAASPPYHLTPGISVSMLAEVRSRAEQVARLIFWLLVFSAVAAR